MKLLACIKALNNILKLNGIDYLSAITIYTDSEYVRKHISYAKTTWSKNRWRTSFVEPVENEELWIKLTKAMAKVYDIYRIDTKSYRVKARSTNPYNKAVNTLAREGADCPIKIPFNYKDVGRKTLTYKAIKGCVELTGNEIEIKVFKPIQG